MNPILFLTALLLGSLPVHAQWTSIGPGGQSLSSISFYDAEYGWTCGSSGALYRTLDGGASWTRLTNFETPGSINRLRSVGLPSARSVYLITETPLNPQPTVIYTSSTRDAPFEADQFGTFNRFVYHHNVPTNLLVGDNGTARVSGALGGPWQNTPSGTQVNLRDGDCPVDGLCYVVGDGGAIRRTNATATGFTGQNSTTSQRLNGVYFASATQGIAVGHNGTVLRTANGGTTWTRIPVPTTVNLHDVWLIDARVGIAVGELGTILVTTDGGLTWQLETSDTFETLYSLTATADGAHIWTAGDGGTVLKRGAIQVPVVTSTHPAAFGQPWQAYPNPFTTALTIELPRVGAQDFVVTVRDAAGRPVHREVVAASSSTHPLTLPTTLPPGIYVLQLLANNHLSETRRLVKLP